jgi:cytochrome P450
VAAMMTYILAVLIHPEVQKKAQEEIDSVIGPDRLPDFSDQDKLPYVNAVLKEVLR